MHPSAQSYYDVRNPVDQTLLGQVPQTSQEEFNDIVAKSKSAFKTWSQTPVVNRQRYMFDLAHLIKQNNQELVDAIVEEHGKTIPDAKGDIHRGLEVVEHACSMASLSMGETVYNIARNIDCYNYRLPLGVTAGICPFNFPAMIPLWMFPLSITLGNTMVMKPSERVPSTTLLLAKYMKEIGIPDGVFQVVNGGFDTVKHIVEHKDIKSISFVGGNNAGEYIHTNGSKNGKRVQANMAAKNHCLILPDADKEEVINQLVGAAFGSTGQRCMALTTAVFVGDSKDMIPIIKEKAQKLTIGPGNREGVDISPVSFPEQKTRINAILDTVEPEGGKFLLDGRGYVNSEFPNGNWVAPSMVEVTD